MSGREAVVECLKKTRSQVAEPEDPATWSDSVQSLLDTPSDGSPEEDWQRLRKRLDEYREEQDDAILWSIVGGLYDLSRWYLGRSVSRIKGIGEKREQQLQRLEITDVLSLSTHYPRAYTDRRYVDEIRNLKEGRTANILGEVMAAGAVQGRRPRYEVRLSDDTGVLRINFWNQTYLSDKINQGMELFCTGQVEDYRGTKQLNNPDYEIIEQESDLESSQVIKPIYPLTEGVSQKQIKKWIERSLDWTVPLLVDCLPRKTRKNQELIPYPRSLEQIHTPEDTEGLDEARRRLVFEEFFFYQLLFVLQAWQVDQTPKDREYPSRDWVVNFLGDLPFELTGDQKQVLDEIEDDLDSDRPMHRLLQGDVGTGKTVVAIASMLRAVENGYQTAMMAPTEVLAEQHYETITREFDVLPCQVELLIGSMPESEKEDIRERMKSGELQFVIGTHALIQEDVLFSELGYVVIDEQHRFGVEQRKELREKGPDVDMLVMSATPIPRSLALTVHGDLRISTLEEFPTGPKQIETTVMKQVDANRQNVYSTVRDRVKDGERAFFVFPAIDDNEETELTAAKEAYERAGDSSFFEGVTLGLLHGRMDREEKQEVMKRFRAGDIQVLFSTTVVEVGIDVPEASFLVVHDAEQFGLAQLHQLRGRVGRGGQQAHCYLFVQPEASDDSVERLRVLEDTLDGFDVARADLRQRGIGDLTGTRQSGAAWFELGDVWDDRDIMKKARSEAERVVEESDGLQAPEYTLTRRKLDHDYREERRYVKVG